MRRARTDGNHATVMQAIARAGYPVRSLHAAGNGVEDLIVGAHFFRAEPPWHLQWVTVEVKVPERTRRDGTAYVRHTDAQHEWYRETPGFPRLVVTGGQDAIDKLSAMGACPPRRG